MEFQVWGSGDPLIALHPLALESTAFAGVADELERLGLRTLGADLPGFGRTPAPDGVPLTPRVLAEPVVELARQLETPPILLGMSLGGRVALEAALLAPEAFGGVVLVAPYLPWRTHRGWVAQARWLDPAWGELLPLERIWPVLKKLTGVLEGMDRFREDWLARACIRVVYNSSCPATRVAMLSAARELALDPAFGPKGLWTRLADLRPPAAFLWAGRDGLIPASHAGHVAEVLPTAHQLEVPCSGHFVNGTHFRCMRQAMVAAVGAALGGPAPRSRRGSRRRRLRCLVEDAGSTARGPARGHRSRSGRARRSQCTQVERA